MTKTRLFLITGLFFAVFLTGFVTRSSEVLILAIPLALYLIVSWYSGPTEIELEATRVLSADRVQMGSEIQVVLSIKNNGPALQNLQIEEMLPEGIGLIDGESEITCALAENESVELSYTIVGNRGAYRIAGVRLTARDSFDLFSKKAVLGTTSRLMIMPKVQKLRRMELRPRQTRIYSGQIPARLGGPGVEFHGVRPYQPGDPMRWINTRLSARQDEMLYINEFEQERVADIGFILDARLASNMPSDKLSLFEYSIEATAALSDYLLDGGNRVGMLIYGGPLNWTFPGYGKIQKERLLQALANARLGDSPIFEDLGYIPTRLFPLRTQLILMSPILEEDLPVLLKLRARGYHTIVVSPDPVTYELRHHDHPEDIALAVKLAKLERDLNLGQLRRAGIQVIDWDLEVPFHQIADQVLSRPFAVSNPPSRISG